MSPETNGVTPLADRSRGSGTLVAATGMPRRPHAHGGSLQLRRQTLGGPGTMFNVGRTSLFELAVAPAKRRRGRRTLKRPPCSFVVVPPTGRLVAPAARAKESSSSTAYDHSWRDAPTQRAFSASHAPRQPRFRRARCSQARKNMRVAAQLLPAADKPPYRARRLRGSAEQYRSGDTLLAGRSCRENR